MHGIISCSAEQQLKYLPEMDHREAAVGMLSGLSHLLVLDAYVFLLSTL